MPPPRRKVSGILLPVSALPGPYGIGDLGPEAFRFIDWLHRAKQHRWQVLPLTIPDSTGSPYASLSGEAGNWLFISPEELQKDNLLPPDFQPTRIAGRAVPYRQVMKTKWQLVRASAQYFQRQATARQRQAFQAFRRRQSAWLEDYTLFQALKDRHQQRPWWTWAAGWRKPQLARRNLDAHLQHQMRLHAYAQWLFAQQWDKLHAYAHRQGISIIGDLPFFVRTDSVDVWAHPELFLLNQRGLPSVVAGVPPDYFARDGQRWGNPLYHWTAHRRTNWQWWIERIRRLQGRCDVIRFDHFRGLVHTWHIPPAAANARRGWWVSSPGASLLRTLKKRVPGLDLVVEDLGNGTNNGDQLRRDFHLPTIRVFIFGWNGLPHNPHVVGSITPDTVFNTSNHDTNTVAGWWRDEAKKYERRNLLKRLKKITNIAWPSIELAWSTPASTVIAPIQDVLGLGSAARFNRPGKQRGNWAWRLNNKQLTGALALRLARLTSKYGRAKNNHR